MNIEVVDINLKTLEHGRFSVGRSEGGVRRIPTQARRPKVYDTALPDRRIGYRSEETSIHIVSSKIRPLFLDDYIIHSALTECNGHTEADIDHVEVLWVEGPDRGGG